MSTDQTFDAPASPSSNGVAREEVAPNGVASDPSAPDKRSDRELAELLAAVPASDRRWPWLFAGLAVGAAAAVLVAGMVDDADATAVDTVEADLVTVVAESRDLVTYDTFDATLGNRRVVDATTTLDGTITATPAVGSVLTRGDVIAEVDGEPVVLWYGDVPAYRDLDAASDDGIDVQQVETNLALLGFDPDTSLTVDEAFTAATATAVSAWETSVGLTATGDLPLGRVVFVPGPAVVTAAPTLGSSARGASLATLAVVEDDTSVLAPVAGAVEELAAAGSSVTTGTVLARVAGTTVVAQVDGDAAPATTDATIVQVVPPGSQVASQLVAVGDVVDVRPLLTLVASAQVVTLDVDVADTGDFPAGLAAEVELADGSLVGATVESIGTFVETSGGQGQGGGATTVRVLFRLDRAPASDLVAGVATVRVEATRADGATVIPVRALVALAEGGYAVEVVNDDTTRLVAVTVGDVQDGLVQVVDGDVEPGTEVVATR